MTAIGGLNIWTQNGDKIRQFTVAEPHEDAALATLREAHPNLTVVSRHYMDLDLIKKLGIPGGKFVEWIPISSKDRLTRAGGVSIDIPMRN